VQFRLGSIPVRVRASFLFVAVLFASSLQRPDAMAVGAAVVFVSILIHELGHAIAAQLYGLEPSIELYGMGGMTSYRPGPQLSYGRQIVISLAGPGAGFLLFAAIVVAGRFGFSPKHELAQLAVELLIWVNLRWGILNLVPLLPMDGGNVMRSALMLLTKGRGEKPARFISIATGGLFILYGVHLGSTWIGFLGAMFTYMNVQALMQAGQRAVDAPLAQAIEKAYAALDKQDGAAAVALLRPVLKPNAAPELRQLGVRLYAYGLLLDEQWDALLTVLDVERAAVGAEELDRYAKAARGVGREEDAARIDAIRTTLAPA
jgi:stage IV sporulation protein FB